MKKLLLLLLIVMAVPVTMMADDPVEINGIYYNLITKAKIAKVTRNPNVYYNGYSGDIVIPSTVHYDNVDYSVKEIESDAFHNCTSLTAITIPDGVTSIGSCAFALCSGLNSIFIPSSVTSIGSSAFAQCSGLNSIIVDSGNAVYDSRDNCNAIIETSSNTLIRGCINTTIPSSVTSIGDDAFSNYSKSIPGGLVYDNFITSINLPDGVTSIGGSAFANCNDLTSINLPDGVTSIGSSAFAGSSLTSINLPDNEPDLGAYVFLSCKSLTSIDIPDGWTTIPWHCFERCNNLTSIIIPNSITTLNYQAFSSCRPTFLEYHNNCSMIFNAREEDGICLSNLETLIIGDEVTSISNTIGNINDISNLTPHQQGQAQHSMAPTLNTPPSSCLTKHIMPTAPQCLGAISAPSCGHHRLAR